MSEFECNNGHLMPSGALTCSICGGYLYSMDGKTARELRAEERYYDNADKEDEDVRDEDNEEDER